MVQWIHFRSVVVCWVVCCMYVVVCEEKLAWATPPTDSAPYDRLGGRLLDEIRVDFKILYRLI